MAACAVENCRRKASRNPPAFQTEGAFGSWVLRLVIDEALLILYPDQADAIDRRDSCLPFTTNMTSSGKR
jgi:hypothetical protein